jgi:hypothetical protein
MAKEIVNCSGCGRDVDISRRSKKTSPIYCGQCMGRGNTTGPSEQKGRKIQRPPEWFAGQVHEDEYDENSNP